MGSTARRESAVNGLTVRPNFHYLTDIHFGAGVVSRVPDILRDLQVSRPLVVSDPSMEELNLLDRLGISSPVRFSQVETNPTEASAGAGLEVFREAGCDGVVAMGGGASIDLAKCICLLAGHEPPLEQYAIRADGTSKITGPLPPLVAVPTTAGSGSEVGRAALLTLDSGDKVGFLSPLLLPKAAVCDPDLTLSLPSYLTAATGMDAVSHCVEAFCSPRFNPVADAIALDGLERAYRNILHATQQGQDLRARAEMMMAALEGGLAFQKGLGAVHSLSHPLGALAGRRLHHGTLNAIFLPAVLRFNFESCQERMAILARRMGLRQVSRLPAAIEKLNVQLGLPGRLRDLGVTREELEPLASKAVADHCTATNPRPFNDDHSLSLYLECW
ncbi:MAG: iron-containing alcohol dehydrogenase [Acidobacteriota bacterium]